MIIPVLTQWIANAVVVLFFPVAFNRAGKAATFSFLAVMSFLQAIFAWRFLPETKGKSLEEIEAHWLCLAHTLAVIQLVTLDAQYSLWRPMHWC